jgi:hypothetical protein
MLNLLKACFKTGVACSQKVKGQEGTAAQFCLAEPRRRAIPVVPFKTDFSYVHFGV